MIHSSLKKEATTSESIEKKQFFIPALTFFLGSLLSIGIFLLVLDWEQSELQGLFELNAQTRLASLQTDIIRHQEVVNSIAGLFNSSNEVSRKEFHDFVQNTLLRQRGIQALEWIPLVSDAELEKHTQLARNSGFENFIITQLGEDAKIQPAQKQDYYLPVFYVEPYAGNEKAVGFDLSSHPGRLAAINMARDTGEPVITERVSLIQGKQKHFGYLLFKAVYQKGKQLKTVEQRRNNFIGLSAGVFRFEDVLSHSTQHSPPTGIDILILDVSAPPENQLLHFHPSRTRLKPVSYDEYKTKGHEATLRWETSLDVLGRKWSFHFTSAPAFIERHKEWQAWMVLFAGLIISLLSSLYVLSKNQHVARIARASTLLEKEFAEHRSQRYFTDTVLNAASDVVVVLNLQGEIVRFNRTAEELTGYTSDELLGQPIWDWLIPADQKEAVKTVFNNLRNGKLDIARHYENEWVMRDKTRRLFQWHNSLLYDENEKVSHIVAMGFDITEMKKAEAEHEQLQRELLQAQKMESLGQLTGGIAHDFNNLLGIINGYASLLLERSTQTEDNKAINYAHHIQEAGDRAAKLVAQMLTFSRNDDIDDTPLQIGELLRENIEMLRATLPSSIEIKTEIEPNLPSVLMNPTNLHQILMNLSINARDAMNGKGQMTIKLALTGDLESLSHISHKPVTGNWVELSVSDTGNGIDAETAKHIFEPFFTTKDVGKGTGMGLSVLYGIMKSHGGHILVDSQPGQGTTFRMLFPPVVDQALEPCEDSSTVAELPACHGGRILVVDDELSLGNYMSELLVKHGYEACYVDDSEKAFALFESTPDNFAMLITDQTMPRLTGEELIHKVREIRPALPVILCTGYSEKSNKNKAKEMNIPFFEKPVDVKDILLKIAELLKDKN